MTSQGELEDFLTLTRDDYDRSAAMYAERFHHHLDGKPIELAVLSAFAGLVAKGPNTKSSTSVAELVRPQRFWLIAASMYGVSTCRPTWSLKPAGLTLAWSPVSDR